MPSNTASGGIKPDLIDEAYIFLSDPDREDVLRSWARGSLCHPPLSATGRPVPSSWIPPRHTVLLHAQVAPEAQVSVLNRGRQLRSGTLPAADVGEAERSFMDSLKPLLGIWYGRIVLLRPQGLPWLVAQIDASAWHGWLRGGVDSCTTVQRTPRRPGSVRPPEPEPEHESQSSARPKLLLCPPPASVLWREGDVIEMFGAEKNDLCCCSLVESPDEQDVEALEADFLNALGLVASSSPEGTLLIDIDADYAEQV